MKHTEQTKEKISDRLKKINPRGIVAILFLLANLAAGAYYGFMTLEVKRVEAILQAKKDAHLSAVSSYGAVKRDDGYKRYQAAKVVKESSDMMDWLENTQYLIELLNRLYEVDQSDDTLNLGSVAINSKEIQLEGNVTAIKSVYREGGVIDAFKDLEFVDTIAIPGYEDLGSGIDFLLKAKIKPYDQ